jgi:hypothetical protein
MRKIAAATSHETARYDLGRRGAHSFDEKMRTANAQTRSLRGRPSGSRATEIVPDLFCGQQRRCGPFPMQRHSDEKLSVAQIVLSRSKFSTVGSILEVVYSRFSHRGFVLIKTIHTSTLRCVLRGEIVGLRLCLFTFKSAMQLRACTSRALDPLNATQH